MSEPDPSPTQISTTQNGLPHPTASIDAITTLIHSFASMITAMESRITQRLQENADASKDRWARWERDFERYQTSTDRRIEIVEIQLAQLVRREEREDYIAEARVRPIRTGLTLLMRNWKTIALVILSFMAVLGFATETIRVVLGVR